MFEAVRALTNMFVESAGEDYLVRTGAVHDLVEKARRDLPADNLAAVKLRWKADRGMLEDAMEEINIMIEESGQGGEEEPDELNDEWDELGFGASKKMSDVELELAKKVCREHAMISNTATQSHPDSTSRAVCDPLSQEGGTGRSGRSNRVNTGYRQLDVGCPPSKISCTGTRARGGGRHVVCTAEA